MRKRERRRPAAVAVALPSHRPSVRASWTLLAVFGLMALFSAANMPAVPVAAAVQAFAVHVQNRASWHVRPKFPPTRRSGAHCSRVVPRVHLLADAIEPDAFARVRRGLAGAALREGLCYDTSGRSSCVLSAAATAAAAPAVRALHHNVAWAARLSDAVGTSLYPLQESRFRMAFTAHSYRSGSFNAPHRDSWRTDAKVWTVILGIDNNSSSQLVVEGEECVIPDNAALVFEGSERLHWVPDLQPAADGSDVQRTIVFLEYTDAPPHDVRWSWPWSRTIVWAERIFLQ